jgi:hypothetical protein
VETEGFPRAEEALRLAAAAVSSARLYPPASALPLESIERFTDRVNQLASTGPIRFVIEPHGVRLGDVVLADGQSQVVALAETLHALQVGQMVFVPGITQPETTAFVELCLRDPAQVRSSGGARAALVAAGASHIAVIEVTLRASEEGGLAGVDLTSAPLDEIAEKIARAAEDRARSAAEGPAADEVAEAVARLEEATRELAIERVAAAMLRLDEATRTRVLNMSLSSDTQGRRMEGMLGVIARMKPAALARLLKISAAQSDTDPRRIAQALTLPPETASALRMMLTPTPSIEPEAEISTTDQAEKVAEIIATETDTADIERQLAIASPSLSAGRALATATAVSRVRLDEETVQAIGEVLPQAARDGAFPTIREALRRLDEIAAEPSLSDSVAGARLTLSDPAVLKDVCRSPQTDADAAIAGEILHAAGAAGSEALLDSYVRAGEPRRSLLKPVLRGMSEGVLGVARQRMRDGDPALVVAIVRVLPVLGDARAVPLIAEMINHLDEQVRFAAISALVAMATSDAQSALVRSINHREPETQRYVVREIGKARVTSAVPVLSRALEDINIFQRTYETRKDIIAALELIGTPEAEKALRRFAQRSIGVGRKTRELRHRAISAAESLAQTRGVRAP